MDCVLFRRGMGKTKYLSAFERCTVVGARHTAFQKYRTAFYAQQFPVCQKWSTTQRTSSQLDTTVGSIGVNMDQHPCGTHDTL
jgi:hypothetical protein